jgi:universal stress protein A
MEMIRIVVGYDRSTLSKRALAHAQTIAQGAGRAEIYVIEVLDAPLPRPGELLAMQNAPVLIEYHRAGIERDLEGIALPRHVTLRAEVGFGDAADAICALAEEKDADFIVVGTHTRSGLERLVLGSVAERTVKHAPCSVIVVRPKKSESEPQVDSKFVPQGAVI